MKKISILSALIFCSVLFPASLNAQTISNSGLASEMTLTVSPESPRPGEAVQFRLEMYTQNLDTAEIAWYVDGARLSSGIGERNFSTAAPSAGKRKTIEVVVKLQNGASFSKQTAISPINFDLIWEANSYTPPFYKGKALFPPQGQVKIMTLTDTGGLVYTWKVNGEVREDLGGYNKKTAIINGPILGKSLVVEVAAVNPTTGLGAKNSLVLEPLAPSVLFYENSPLYGVLYNRALKNISLNSDEVTILGAPYNLSRTDIDTTDYTWRINGTRVVGAETRSVVFRRPEKASGRSSILLEAKNSTRPLQLVEGSFLITFEE